MLRFSTFASLMAGDRNWLFPAVLAALAGLAIILWLNRLQPHGKAARVSVGKKIDPRNLRCSRAEPSRCGIIGGRDDVVGAVGSDDRVAVEHVRCIGGSE